MATISYRRYVGLLALWLSATAAFGQSQPWAVQWNQHAFSAQAGRDYLGITNFIPGTNVSFSHPSALVYKINLAGGSPMPPGSGVWWTDGTNIWWTNTIPGQAYIGDGVGPHINLYTDGRGNFESNLTTKAKLSSQTLEVSSSNVFGGIIYANGPSNIFKGQIVQTNAAQANTFLELDGQRVTAGNVIEYKTNNVSKFSVSSAGVAAAAATVSGGALLSAATGGVEINGRIQIVSPALQQIGIDYNNPVTNIFLGKAQATNICLSHVPGSPTAGTPTLRVLNGTYGAADLVIGGTLTATNGQYYFIAQTNAGVTTNAWQPLHTFAALMGYATNTINGGANTYAIVTNYSTVRTNLMNCSPTAGTITNTIAGFYYVAIHMSMKSVDAGALVEGDLLLNGVERDEVSFQTQFDPGTPRYKGASAFGILYIPAGTQITFQVKSSGAGGIEIRRQQLVVMPP